MSQQITLDNYKQAKETFIHALEPIQDNIHTLYLFGSYARGEAIPGYSDLDFCLFFEDEALADEAQFQQVMETLLDGMAAVQSFGIPLYNFCSYWSASQIGRLPAMLASNLAQPANSQLLLGAEVRERMDSPPFSRALTQKSTFFEMRRQLYLPLLPLLQLETLPQEAKFGLFTALQYIKYVPEAACAALDQWPGEAAAAGKLATLLPELDLSPIKAIKQFCVERGMGAADEELIAWGKTAVFFVEAVNDALLNKLN